jgi:hypothetical protein
MKKLLSLFLAMIVVSGGLVALDIAPQPAQALAVSGSEFDAGFIISDEVFFNSNAMSEGQIQSFLQSTIGPCSNDNCLSVKKLDTASRSGDAMCGPYNGAAQEPVARILFKVGQACGINPQVLIVMLQKEQSLISGPISRAPSNSRLDRAMGYACPDNTVIPGYCDPAFGGVYNQLYKAAWQYKRYANPPGTSAFFTKFRPGATANVQYNVPVSCGTKAVHIRNQATANLYYYTPYTPNAAALGNLYGTGDGCSAYGNRNFWVYFNNWFGSSTGAISPLGSFDFASSAFNGYDVGGWALDPSTKDQIQVRFTEGGSTVGTTTARTARADVGAAYPGWGNNRGYSMKIEAAPGVHNVCAQVINVGPGSDRDLGCRTVRVAEKSPVGGVTASVKSGRIAVQGWTIDPDTADPVKVHVYVDGKGAAITTANVNRPDVGVAYPKYGSKHGINVEFAAAEGAHRVCAYAINVGGGENTELGCSAVNVPGVSPIGGSNVESRANGIELRGWTIDPDTTAPVTVHVYSDGVGVAVFAADDSRTDIARTFPAYGAQHGIRASVSLKPGSHNVCAYAINVGAGSNSSLGCHRVTVQSELPIGGISTEAAPGAIKVRGWTIDMDYPKQVLRVHYYLDGVGVHGGWAAMNRPDVARAYPAAGPEHGIESHIDAAPGERRLCAYAINVGGGDNRLLGCERVTVPAA